MKNQKLNYTVVGCFVIAMLVAAVATAVTLTGRTGARDRFVIVFDNVSDIRFGTLVRYEGYPVGQVEGIIPRDHAGRMKFALDVSVLEGWQIPSDSIAQIGSSTFLGAKVVEIRGGRSTAALAPGDEIASAPPADMFAAMSGVASEFGDVSRQNLRPLLQQLTNLATNANALLEDDLSTFVGSLNSVASDAGGRLPRIAAELQAFTGKLNTSLDKIQSVLSDQNIRGINQVLANVEEASRQFVEISINAQGTLGQLDGLVSHLEKLVEANEGKVSSTLDDTRYTLRSIAQSIDAINHNLAGTTRNMNEFSRLIRQNPGLLLGGASPEDVSVEASSTPSTHEVQ